MQKIFLLFLFSFVSILYADVYPRAIDLSVPNHEIGHSLLEYEDPAAAMTLSQIRHLSPDDFTPLNKSVAGHPFTNSAFWYRFDVENKEDTPLSRLIVFEPAWLDSINITIVSSKGELQSYEGGNIYPYSKRAINHYLINFMHEFDPGLSTVYVRVKTRDPFIVSISVMEESAFFENNMDVYLCIGLIYGGIIAMLFYNLFLFIGIKEKYYAFYVLYLSTFFLMNASYNGYTFMYLFSNYPSVQNWAQSTSIFLFILAGLLFSRSFLNLKKYHQKLYKTTTYLVFLIIIAALVLAIFGTYRYHVILSVMLTIPMSLYIFGIAFFSWSKGNRSARFFLLGVTSGLIGTAITALTVMSFIPFTRITYRANDFGIFIDVVLLSIALADRMRMTQEKKIIAEKEAKTDILTGLFNRRAYYEISEMEYQKLLRHDRVLSVVMFDVDEFKKVNDTWGHNTGDIVLQHIAKLARETIREYDYAFRMGGDEFLLLLPETNEKQASIMSERLREKIEIEKIIDSRGKAFSVTASFGVVEYTQREMSMEALTRRADEALYQAKKSGRNQVEILDKYAII